MRELFELRGNLVPTVMLLVALGCGKGGHGDALATRGRLVYMTSCISCHNPDPKKAGNVGPALYGSSLLLLQMRVLQVQYPPGYAPKRPTKLMPPLPHLAPEIEALHAFLNAH
jgi:mono/diheme cytochrome c family protein